MKKILSFIIALALVLSLAGCSFLDSALDNFFTFPSDSQGTTTAPTAPSTTPPPTQTTPTTEISPALDEDGFYYSKEDVALYIHIYGRLPANFVTKSQASSQFGSNNKAMIAGYRIGGDTFQNREGLLPKKAGRSYTECDIAAPGQTQRGAYRIVFSNDGLVYYTHDHYRSFELLYGEP